jgi:hypothetical protein
MRRIELTEFFSLCARQQRFKPIRPSVRELLLERQTVRPAADDD